MPEFGKDIGWVALVIMAMISDLHPGWKQTHVATFPGYMSQVPRAPFSPVTKSNIEM